MRNDFACERPTIVQPLNGAARRQVGAVRVVCGLLTFSLLLIIAVAVVRSYHYPKQRILLKLAANVATAECKLCVFPVVSTPDGMSVASSYIKELAGFGYHRLRFDFSNPSVLPFEWVFAKHPRAERYGFIMRRWYADRHRRSGEIDNSDIRVFWVKPEALDAALACGVLEIPGFERLVPFDAATAKQMLLTGDDVVPPRTVGDPWFSNARQSIRRRAKKRGTNVEEKGIAPR